MELLEQYKQRIENILYDLRLEVLLSEIISDDVKLDDIEIVTNSVFLRNHHYEIEKADVAEYINTHNKRLRLVINRDGIYDSLPEDLLHQPVNTQVYLDKEGILNEMKVQQQREQSARDFFLPYEQEFYRLRVKLEAEIKQFMFANSGQMDADVLTQLWQFPDFFTTTQKTMLGLLMPVMHRLLQNKELCSFMASHISGDEVEIQKGFHARSSYTDDPILSGVQLSNELILGGEYISMEPSVNWVIKLNKYKDLAEYMPGGKKAVIHEFLSNLMIPLDTDVNIELDLSNAKEGFVLNEEPAAGRLGYVTYI